MKSKKPKARDFKAEYRHRIDLGKARGYSHSQASGHPKRKKGERGITEMNPEELSVLTQKTLGMLPTTRRELKEDFKLYAPSIEVLIKHMLAQGLITETKIKKGKRGRPELLIERKNKTTFSQDIPQDKQRTAYMVATSPCVGCTCNAAPEACSKLDEWLVR